MTFFEAIKLLEKGRFVRRKIWVEEFDCPDKYLEKNLGGILCKDIDWSGEIDNNAFQLDEEDLCADDWEEFGFNISFMLAIKSLIHGGRKIRHASFEENEYLILDEKGDIQFVNIKETDEPPDGWQLTIKDLCSANWEVSGYDE